LALKNLCNILGIYENGPNIELYNDKYQELESKKREVYKLSAEANKL